MILNESRLKSLRGCPREYQLKYELNLVPRYADRMALDFGGAIHCGLQTVYNNLTGQPENDAIESFAKVLREKELEQYGIQMLQQYCKKYLAQDRERWEVLAVETELWYNTGIVELGGRLDLVVEDKELGGRWHVQHKTLGANASIAAYVQAQQMSGHERLYTLLWNRTFPEKPITGTILNTLRKTKCPSFERFYLSFQGKDLADYLDSVMWYAQKLEELRSLYKDEWWPSNTDCCVRYQRPCDYYNTCQNGSLFERDYEKREEDYIDTHRGQ